jgi:hypothetical protein
MCLLCHCRKDDPSPSLEQDPVFKTVQFDGVFVLSPEDPTSITDLTILSITDESNLSEDGSFNIESVENEKYQIFMVASKISGETTYYGISDPGTGEVLINDSTTALGLLLINPYLISTEQEQRKQFLDQASAGISFQELVHSIAQARKTDPNDPLNPDLHPEISQKCADLTVSTMKKLGDGESEPKYMGYFINVIDKADRNVVFESYKFVFYAADISYPFTDENDVLLLDRKQKLLKWRWWTPQWTWSGPAETEYEMKDGYVEIKYYKFALGKVGDPGDNAKEIATGMNLVYGIFYTLDIMGGLVPRNVGLFRDIGRNITTQGSIELANMSSAILKGDEYEVMDAVVNLLKSAVGIGILKHMIGNMNNQFKNSLTKSLKNVLVIYSLLGYANEHIPFFVDLIRPTPDGPFKYIHLNGVLTSVNENLPPEASISFSPGIGYNETQITFKVNDYMDDITPQEDALFSWQWVEDGVELPEDDSWSAPSSDPTKIMTLSSPGRMWLKVDDRLGETYICCSRKVTFYESVEKTRIIVVTAGEDRFTDYKDYIENELNYGAIGGNYVLTTPDEFNSLAIHSSGEWKLNPQTDLLVFHINCVSEYLQYRILDCYNDNKLAIANFISKGGNFYFIVDNYILLREGDVINFRGEIYTEFPEMIYLKNSTESTRHFIPSESDSLEVWNDYNRCNWRDPLSFSSIPDNALVHIAGNKSEPVLFEINTGKGNTLFSTVSYDCKGAEIIYKNAILYLLGVELK